MSSSPLFAPSTSAVHKHKTYTVPVLVPSRQAKQLNPEPKSRPFLAQATHSTTPAPLLSSSATHAAIRRHIPPMREAAEAHHTQYAWRPHNKRYGNTHTSWRVCRDVTLHPVRRHVRHCHFACTAHLRSGLSTRIPSQMTSHVSARWRVQTYTEPDDVRCGREVACPNVHRAR